MPNKKEARLLRLLADNDGVMNHENKALDPFSGDNGKRCDTFNRCSAQGWIRSTHDNDSSESWAHLTPEGRKFIETANT